jgi:hypothetical protein
MASVSPTRIHTENLRAWSPAPHLRKKLMNKRRRFKAKRRRRMRCRQSMALREERRLLNRAFWALMTFEMEPD